MSNDKIALILFVASICIVAVAMELVKSTGTKKPIFWWTLSGIMSAVCTCSVWFGVDHTGNLWLLPLALIAGYAGQYTLDMYGVKKVFVKVFNALAVKHGYEKIEDKQDV